MWPLSTQLLVRQVLTTLEGIMADQRRTEAAMIARLDRLESLLSRVQLRRFAPGPLQLRITGENLLANTIQFKVLLPTKSAADVTSRELRVTQADGSVETFTLDSSAVESGELSGVQGSTITVELVDVDDAGNRSEPSTATFDLADTMAPPKPGDLGLQVTGETAE